MCIGCFFLIWPRCWLVYRLQYALESGVSVSCGWRIYIASNCSYIMTKVKNQSGYMLPWSIFRRGAPLWFFTQGRTKQVRTPETSTGTKAQDELIRRPFMYILQKIIFMIRHSSMSTVVSMRYQATMVCNLCRQLWWWSYVLSIAGRAPAGMVPGLCLVQIRKLTSRQCRII